MRNGVPSRYAATSRLWSEESQVQATVALANGLEIPVTAEGIETQSQAVIAKLCGCDLLQGYLFSKPAPAEEICSVFHCTGNFCGGRFLTRPAFAKAIVDCNRYCSARVTGAPRLERQIRSSAMMWPRINGGHERASMGKLRHSFQRHCHWEACAVSQGPDSPRSHETIETATEKTDVENLRIADAAVFPNVTIKILKLTKDHGRGRGGALIEEIRGLNLRQSSRDDDRWNRCPPALPAQPEMG